ncbi:4-hydroxyproline epimerase [Meridianimarinicoccus aquatilis]|uniref:Hydroxyproline-2-epimerase n=1 Tax=Meridianimarinicoccus aquatilis TaxID=2552766 RepID=A0A4R6B2J7_9RHOB|nr:proline racemase family protein [Fluviibacterium aquatile]TDL90840.1 hydroxyproline-2-epimerase [Fluviibacterium aquatile]
MHVIDSHTGGEPTRVILDGGPDLGTGPLSQRAARLASDYGDFMRSVCFEPRGQVAMVCALLVPPCDPTCAAGVIYFDAAAVLGMCGHGTIGLAVTLMHMDRVGPGAHRLETPAGVVGVDIIDANTVTVTNIESRRTQAGVTVDVPGLGRITGDVAYGGNWFFLVEESPVPVRSSHIRPLTDAAIAVRAAVVGAGIDVDHVIFYGPADGAAAHSRNFVLCPDDAYDRSPCGTGCSARLACLAADGRLAVGEDIIQQSVIGSTYRLSYRRGSGGGVIPQITGQAFVTSEAKLFFDPNDPFRGGIIL